MSKEQKKRLRKQLIALLEDPNADLKEIERIGKWLGEDKIPPNRNPQAVFMSREDFERDSQTMSDSEIAAKYNLTLSSISKKRKAWGFPRRYEKTPLTYDEYVKMRSDFKNFPTDRAIEKHLGYKPGTITRLRTCKWIITD